MTAPGTPTGSEPRAIAARSIRAGGIAMVARMTALDLLRRPGTWSVTLLTGIVFAVLFGGVGIVTSATQERAENISFSIAVDGDLAGGRGFVEQLRSNRLIVTEGDAQARVTQSRATAGLTLPEGLDERIARREPTELRVYFRQSQNNSQEALNLLLVRVQELELAGLAPVPTDAATSRPQPVDVIVQEVKQDPRVNRNQFASGLAAMACIICLGTVSSVTALFGRSQEQRTLEPMLVLPLRRPDLTIGLAVGAFPVATLQLVVCLALLVTTTALPVEGLQQPAGEVARMLALGTATALGLGALATAVGCLAGAIGVGSDEAVSLGDFLALPFVAVGVTLFLQPDLTTNAATTVVPILGVAVNLRDAIRGSASPGMLVLALLATVLWSVVLVRAASTRIAAERRLLRATR